jgi:LPS export ABC transporter protein LptC
MIKSFILFLGIILLHVLIFTSCENDMKVVEHLSGRGEITPSESSKNLNLLYTDSGKMQFRLKSPYMEHFVYGVKEPYSEFNKGVYIEYYDENHKVKTILKADYAIRFDNSKKMEAKYKVEVTNENGEILRTEKIIWDEENRKIFTDEYVEITTKREILKGKGMEANQDFSEWEIKEVSGTIPLDQNQ